MSQSFQIQEPSDELRQKASLTRAAFFSLSNSTDEERREALNHMADSLKDNSEKIIEDNRLDYETSSKDGISNSLLSRLKLDRKKLDQGIDGVRKVAELKDPLGKVFLKRELDKNLILSKVSVPLGVLGVIFEARPDAAIQIASLAIRSGNCAILKGGSEAKRSNISIVNSLKEGLSKSQISKDSLLLLTTRSESLSILKLDEFVNLIIPRGSNDLVKFIQANTNIPVLGHADGICHLYIDKSAKLDLALKVALDSKIQYPAACNSIETLLVHKDIAESFLERAINLFKKEGVKLLGDENSRSLGIEEFALESDWSKEYLDLKLSIKVVSNHVEAINHINKYGSKHTDAIISEDKSNIEEFMKGVDSAGVFHNCSTRFADGFRYGFGAEVGISTQILPPRGPVGLEGLVTYRYFLTGEGQVVKDYASGVKTFSHIDHIN
tara:strand:+ start:12956 stop:14272 length:1317 start_codon:yes stop_codon:yes gene_type:complete